MMATTQSFCAEEWERLGLPHECEGGQVLEDVIVDHTRWSVLHRLTFRLDDQPIGEAWRVRYSVPATESQDEPEPDEYIATLVRAVEKTVTVYEPVP
jgi:hypothetical protein